MKIQGQLEWTDYLEAQLLHMRLNGSAGQSWYLIMIFFGFILASSFYPLIIGRGDLIQTLLYAAPFLIIVGLLLINRYVLFPGNARRIYDQQKDLSAPFEMEITDASLITKNQYGYYARPWSHLRKWKENRNILMLYYSDILFTILPKRFCTNEQIEALHAYLRENKVPESATLSRGSRLISFVIYFVLIIVIAIIVFGYASSQP